MTSCPAEKSSEASDRPPRLSDVARRRGSGPDSAQQHRETSQSLSGTRSGDDTLPLHRSTCSERDATLGKSSRFYFLTLSQDAASSLPFFFFFIHLFVFYQTADIKNVRKPFYKQQNISVCFLKQQVSRRRERDVFPAVATSVRWCEAKTPTGKRLFIFFWGAKHLIPESLLSESFTGATQQIEA